MKVYFLTRSSRPAIQDGQMKTVLLCLEPTGTKKDPRPTRYGVPQSKLRGDAQAGSRRRRSTEIHG